MPSPRLLLATFAICFLVTLSLTSVMGPRTGQGKAFGKDTPPGLNTNAKEAGDSTFAQLLRSASPDVLHRLLHAHIPDRYQHGVYPSDNDALAAVHEDNAPLATSLARLAKRQNGDNSTDTDTATSTDSTTDAVDTSISDPTSDPTSESTLDPTTDATTDRATDPSPTDEPTGSTDPPTSNTPGPTPDPTPTEDPDDKPDTQETEKTTSKTTRTRSSAVPTTFTSTLPNGGVTIITSTSYFDYDPAEETVKTDSRPEPTLQNAAPRNMAEAALPVALGFAVAGIMAV